MLECGVDVPLHGSRTLHQFSQLSAPVRIVLDLRASNMRQIQHPTNDKKTPSRQQPRGGQLQIISNLVGDVHRRVRVPTGQLPHHPQSCVVLPPQRRHLATQIPNVCF